MVSNQRTCHHLLNVVSSTKPTCISSLFESHWAADSLVLHPALLAVFLFLILPTGDWNITIPAGSYLSGFCNAWTQPFLLPQLEAFRFGLSRDTARTMFSSTAGVATDGPSPSWFADKVAEGRISRFRVDLCPQGNIPVSSPCLPQATGFS